MNSVETGRKYLGGNHLIDSSTCWFGYISEQKRRIWQRDRIKTLRRTPSGRPRARRIGQARGILLGSHFGGRGGWNIFLPRTANKELLLCARMFSSANMKVKWIYYQGSIFGETCTWQRICGCGKLVLTRYWSPNLIPSYWARCPASKSSSIYPISFCRSLLICYRIRIVGPTVDIRPKDAESNSTRAGNPFYWEQLGPRTQSVKVEVAREACRRSRSLMGPTLSLAQIVRGQGLQEFPFPIIGHLG